MAVVRFIVGHASIVAGQVKRVKLLGITKYCSALFGSRYQPSVDLLIKEPAASSGCRNFFVGRLPMLNYLRYYGRILHEQKIFGIRAIMVYRSAPSSLVVRNSEVKCLKKQVLSAIVCLGFAALLFIFTFLFAFGIRL